MGIILWIIFGALVGWVASIIMKTNLRMGFILNVVVGIVGAVVGGWIMSLFGFGTVISFDIYGFMVALLGAIVLIAIIKMLRYA
jgi:uncharacterized membrane protein YeaQ/YmgE (transglycosylase-associated protein family)